MLASTWLDIVIGIDLHFELVPPPMLPIPFPHPFVGLVLDPIGLAAGLAISNAIGMAMGGSFKGPVLINLMPANTTGTEAKNFFLLPHFIIPPGAMWAPMFRVPKPAIIPGKAPSLELPIPPPGDAMMITGSKTVHAMGANLCRLGDIALSCSDPIRLPTSVVLTIPKGLPVLVGGPPAVDWMAAGFGLIKCKWIASRLHRLVSRIKSARLRNLLHRGICFLTGHPVDVATGRVMTYTTDFELPGPLPLVFERSYASSWAHRDSPLGHGWSHPLDQAVWIEPGCVVYRAEDGREIEFDTFDMPDHAMRPGEEVFEPLNRLTLRSLGRFRWEIEAADGVVHELEPIPGDRDRTLARLVRKRTRNGHEITLHYDDRARLSWVRDAGGRIVRFEHDEAGRLAQVSLPHPTQPGWVPHTRYVYSGEGDLVEAIDPLGNAIRYEYAGHLLVRETDRTGLSFYFGYDGNGPDAYCIRTWGDGGIYDHEIDYDKAGRVTYVTNSLDATTTYEMNVAYAVVKVTDACGGEARFEYDDNLWLTAEIDPLGNETRYEHDARGNCTRVVGPDGAESAVTYDGRGLPVRRIDAGGATWRWRYDEAGNLVEHERPSGEVLRLGYERGLLAWIDAGTGGRTEMDNDAHLEVAAVRRPGRGVTRYHRDALGRVVRVEDAGGGSTHARYDAMGRLVRVEAPSGEVEEYVYDAEGALLEARSARRQARFRYAGLRRVVEREEAGARLRFEYDTEERLVGIVNEAGERCSFQLDACGRLVGETGFDGRRRRHERDAAGRVTVLRRASGRWSRFGYDAAGRLARVETSDGAITRLSYRPDGLLVRAENDAGALTIERDAQGRILREAFEDGWVASRYGRAGERESIETSFGTRVRVRSDAAGEPAALELGNASLEGYDAAVVFARDALGLEAARHLPGGVSAVWQRDVEGRPTERRILRERRGGAREEAGSRLYEWRGDDEIAAIADAARGVARYTHDARGRLVAAQLAGGAALHRAMDPVGNVYRTPDGRDRRYGPGGRVEQADDVTYAHDADGNLVERREPDGKTWRYHWTAAGLLREVERPDGRRVRFAYDALARRTRKQLVRIGPGGEESIESETRFLWDGDVVVNEVASGGAMTAWHWEPDTFTLVAREREGRRWGIATDHLGAPTEMYDETGQLVYCMQLDLFGAPTLEAGAPGDCPWRWPGQYEDPETGLYYNRYRYYSPELGLYISEDPLRTGAGLHLYTYAADPLVSIDPLGLVSLFGILRYGHRFHRGDGLDAHEFLQNAWLEEHGLIRRRGQGLSRHNPAIGIPENPLHTAINRAQDAAGLYDRAVLRGQTATQNILANAAIFERETTAYLISRGATPQAAAAQARKLTARMRRQALRFAQRIGCA
ncbi:DUF6531 domain-containing protein [Sorangium sp. So ce1097]|uniref:DUF6531 domain-containing protein n=1 Tax=Sorangium sp. So ce1097 TaxID=3133330 RepID=UPI003F61D246